MSSLGDCSFSLPERTVCTDMGCKASTDGGLPPDMAKDPNDPAALGMYRVATLAVTNPPNGISNQVVLGPSDDGATLSMREAKYPLVVMAPPQFVSVDGLRPYAEWLCGHGFVVAIFQVSNESSHTTYRDAGVAYLSFLLNNTDPSIKDHLDGGHLGLSGYQLGAKIAVGMAAQYSLVGALFLIEPEDVVTAQNPFDGVATMAQVSLSGGNTVAMLGDPLSTTGSPACVGPPQRGWQEFYGMVKSPALSISFGNANLGDFMENYPDTVCYNGSTAPRTRTQTLTMKYMTAYFQWTLKGQARARDYLLGPDFAVDQQNASLTEQSK